MYHMQMHRCDCKDPSQAKHLSEALNQMQISQLDGAQNAALAARVSEISKRFTGCLLGTCGTGHVEAVGAQARYLLHETGNTTGIPDMVFLQGPKRRMHGPGRSGARYLQVFSCSSAACVLGAPAAADGTAGGGSAAGSASTRTAVLAGGVPAGGLLAGGLPRSGEAVDMNKLLRDVRRSNVSVSRHILPILCKVLRGASTAQTAVACRAAAPCPEGITVRVPRAHGEPAGTLQIDPLGLECARANLRKRSCLPEWAAEVPASADACGCHVVLAQNESYTASMQLCADAFSLQLHHTEDLFANPSGAAPLVSMSHRFHPLDRVVEEVHGDQRTRGKVTGLLAAAQALLRRNMVAASVHSLGVNHGADAYTGMHAMEAAQVAQAMQLVSDDAHVANAVDLHYRANVVQPVHGSELFGGEAAPAAPAAGAAPATDFHMHHSGALSYAIAHQNTAVTGVLNRGTGLDLQQISTALYSGVAFCHACAYEVAAGDTAVHVVNASDFSGAASTAAAALAADAVHAASQAAPAGGWSELRHSFHVARCAGERGAGSDGETAPPLGVVCHATSSGLLVFRRSGDCASAPSFVGVVYVPPCLVDQRPLAQQPCSAAPLASAPPAQTATRPQTLALLASVTELAAHTPSSRHALLSTATRSLFHLNAMCMHSNHNHSSSPGMKRRHHEVMRKAWLHTHALRAARLCGGVTNAAFNSIYAHLSNLAALPLNSAGYWATVPYA